MPGTIPPAKSLAKSIYINDLRVKNLCIFLGGFQFTALSGEFFLNRGNICLNPYISDCPIRGTLLAAGCQKNSAVCIVN
jgi:hypothetical protein